MSFREKIHWVAFVALFLAFGWYFATYPWAIIDTPAGVGAGAAKLVPVAIIILGAMALVSVISVVRNPKETHVQEDEREKSIHHRGTHIAYYLLILGVWANLFAIFYHVSAAGRLNLLIATAVIAELVRVGVQLYYYRRGV